MDHPGQVIGSPAGLTKIWAVLVYFSVVWTFYTVDCMYEVAGPSDKYYDIGVDSY